MTAYQLIHKRMKMNPVVHFEMPYEDQDRMVDFYNKAFGWQANRLGAEMGNYVVVATTETDPATHMIKEPGRINGGLFKRSKPDQCPSIVIAVDDIHEAMQKVKDAGGIVLGGMHASGEPDDIPGVGLYCGAIDSEGNRISMLQPHPEMANMQ
jgi:predicted enzyme related to lactoylglutathione lyase